MFLHVKSVKWIGDYRLRLAFNDGSTMDVDLKDELDGVVFSPLRDTQFFGRVSINDETGTIEWPNGADFAPEFLHALGTGLRSEGTAPSQFVREVA